MVTETGDTRTIAGAGTAEARWRPWLDEQPWPPLPELAGLHRRVVVVAPHPDDEVLGLGGLMATLGRATIVAVTDGEASHPGSTVFTPDQLAQVRRAETAQALAELGLSGAEVVRLGHRDGGIDETGLTRQLRDVLRPGDVCLATWRRDGHPDHETVGTAAATACAAVGATLLEYPIWMWHWAVPGSDQVPWSRARRIALTAPALAAKATAIAAFTSQINPVGPAPADAAVLPPPVVARFLRPYELVFLGEAVAG